LIHDQVASTITLAKVILFGIDRLKFQTTVNTGQLVLLLDTLIDLGSLPSPVADSAKRSVMGAIALMSEEARSQQDIWQKEADAEASMVEQSRR
jgi:hypothetical protein